VAAVTVLNVPGIQCMHVLFDHAPMLELHWPAAHDIQPDSADTPVSSLYVPAGHCVHVAILVAALVVL